jgi:hypothetical protein
LGSHSSALGAISTTKRPRLLGEAFDAARAALHDRGQPEIVYEIIAKRIVEAAKKGERDLTRLRDAGLAALGYERDVI